ncbi:MAG: hypothetical protein HOH04_00725 [Rhodospirillaceae bacterium]|jgi:hypothetical protein|nr:hypothetical protein [Rhodospirillaceae bacterium]
MHGPALRLAFILLFAAFIAGDSAHAGGSKKKDPKDWVQPTHIQMQPMMLRAGHTNVPITFFLEAGKPEQVEDICKHMPRVRDAVLLTVSRKPITVRKNRLVLKGLDRRIFGPVNRAVGRKFVRKIFVAKGAVRMGTGKIKQRPFAVIGDCVNILRSSREREQAARAAANK